VQREGAKLKIEGESTDLRSPHFVFSNAELGMQSTANGLGLGAVGGTMYASNSRIRRGLSGIIRHGGKPSECLASDHRDGLTH